MIVRPAYPRIYKSIKKSKIENKVCSFARKSTKDLTMFITAKVKQLNL